MKDDWDRRAREDASYYVAFGRRRQSPEEFFASAADVLSLLRAEYPRIATGRPLHEARAVEIGCGPGRLLVPLSADFGEIQGFDVSGQMVQLARKNLADHPNARATQCSGSDIPAVADSSVDFVYSYAVFQHIPDREAILNYLRESVRVMLPGGLLVCQVHGLQPGVPDVGAAKPGWSLRACVEEAFSGERPPDDPDTWSGVRFTPEELAAFCTANGLELLAFRGIATQYLWMVARKPVAVSSPTVPAKIARITNAYTSDTVIPRAGVFASATLWVRGLASAVDLNAIHVRVDGTPVRACYVGEPDAGQLRQVNVFLPPGLRTGTIAVELLVDGAPAAPATTMRVGPSPPLVPRLVRLSDGIDLLHHGRVKRDTLKLQIEELRARSVADARERGEFSFNGHPMPVDDVLCIDPRLRLFEFNVRLPDDTAAGPGVLEFRLGRQALPPVGVIVER